MSLTDSTHFYDPRNGNHGLPHDPIKSCVIPRPIGWISSLSDDGVPNLAPYSYFNLVCDSPLMVVIGSNGEKDTLRNLESEGGDFVFNMVTEELVEAMNRSATDLAPEVDEIAECGLTPLPGVNVKAPRIAESPIHLECQTHSVIDLNDRPSHRNAIILGKVVGVHINPKILRDGLIDVRALRPAARLGYMQYATVGSDLFELVRPKSLDDYPKIKPL